MNFDVIVSFPVRLGFPMAYFQNDDLEYVVTDYYGDVAEFEEEENDAFADNQPRRALDGGSDDDSDDDFEEL